MSKLKRFSKSNKKNIMPLVALCSVVAVVFAAISYAVYQKEDEVLFINARVGEFETSSSDIELAMTLDGEDVDVPPSKGDGYYNVIVECDNAIGRWDKEEWTAVIGNITSNRVKCNVNFETLETLASITKVGDYISMTPTSTSYTILTSLTGYSSNQTINPSELNLWRVIKKNEDGTVEVVSEYVSSKTIYFYGQAGYLNLVGGLNTIAAQYTNSKYVLKTRHMGYSNQIEKCTTSLNYNNSSTCPADTGYITDTNLIQAVLGTLGKISNGTSASYWLASRGGYADSKAYFYEGNYISLSGNVTINNLIHINPQGGTAPFSSNASVRPILTLKSDVEILSGDGQSDSTAYQLS